MRFVLTDQLEKLFLHIPKSFFQAFLFALGIALFVYASELTNFPYWDHDFAYLRKFGFVNTVDGRWFGDLLSALTFFEMIPQLALTISFVLRIAGGILCVYFFLRTTAFIPLVTGGLFAVLFPENVAFYLYRFQTIMSGAPLLLMASALLISEQRGGAYKLVAVLLVWAALGSYPTILNTFGIFIVGKVLLDIITQQGAFPVKRWGSYVAIVAIPLPLHLALIKWLQYQKLMGEAYNTKTVGITEAISRIPTIIQQSFAYFNPETNIPYMPALAKWIVLGIIAVSTISLLISFAQNNKKFLCIGIVSILCIVVSSKIVFLITFGFHPTSMFVYRIASYGTLLLTLFFMCVLFITLKNKDLRSIYIFTICILFYVFISQDMLFQRHNRDQFIADILFAQRIAGKIEEIEGIDLNTQYRFIPIGTQPYVARNAWVSYDYTKGLEEFRRPSMATWMPQVIINYVAPHLKLSYFDISQIDDLTQRYQILTYALSHVWPDKNSIILLDSTTLLCVFDARNVSQQRKELADVMRQRNIPFPIQVLVPYTR